MFRRILLILILTFFLASCGAAAPATWPPAATEAAPTEAATEAPAATEPPAFQSLEAPTRTAPQDLETATPPPLPTQPAVTRTDTPLPTLDLPTEIVDAPARMVWDGVPTYLAESAPGYAFRVRYDPELWALTADQFGFPALAQRGISGCVISVTAGRGLPLNLTVEHDRVTMGELAFDVGNVFENGALKFVTYTGSDGRIVTGFQIDFREQADECRARAFAVISTLTSVPTSRATPTPTP